MWLGILPIKLSPLSLYSADCGGEISDIFNFLLINPKPKWPATFLSDLDLITFCLGLYFFSTVALVSFFLNSCTCLIFHDITVWLFIISIVPDAGLTILFRWRHTIHFLLFSNKWTYSLCCLHPSTQCTWGGKPDWLNRYCLHKYVYKLQFTHTGSALMIWWWCWPLLSLCASMGPHLPTVVLL